MLKIHTATAGVLRALLLTGCSSLFAPSRCLLRHRRRLLLLALRLLLVLLDAECVCVSFESPLPDGTRLPVPTTEAPVQAPATEDLPEAPAALASDPGTAGHRFRKLPFSRLRHKGPPLPKPPPAPCRGGSGPVDSTKRASRLVYGRGASSWRGGITSTLFNKKRIMEGRADTE